ncbi:MULTISPECIES: hypothetical protein [unclassified Salinivibrio]|uniref:hypothetical protein n=1 Tax=unclassified Salinivibrio TaxID=2636825 RepID=UPI00128E7347|nr:MULTISPECIES: hypothetical protein [unclassified Salinivibrio]MPS31179.1 hypothetical protein [Salinivibrio sp. VYel7]MPX92579.1 hypothetical protein [Salinivibrio sp. VYel9]MPX96923.1 hypothetical protein [Salinivibrio sp. VYel6]MPX98811.1 hypothetical protein [Salinivibrio sp. VYel4]MPY01488.1 hypothetical protein [Salinivibrio sp. VYel5]
MMSYPAIPHFVKAMGHRVVSYILNVTEAEGRLILMQKLGLSRIQRDTLNQYIELCRQLRVSAVEQGESEQSFFYRLPHVMQNGRHVFNVWRAQQGGELATRINSSDPLTSAFCQLAGELYPLFLIKAGQRPHLFYRGAGYLTAAIEQFPVSKQVQKRMAADPALSRLFTTSGKEPQQTCGYYKDASGHRGVVSLASLPVSILVNSYDLMRIRGVVSPDTFVETVQEMLEMARSLADGEVAHIPMFVGFRNAALTNLAELDTKWGSVRRYTPGIAEYVLQAASLMAKRRDNGFMLESGYAFAINFGDFLEDDDWPEEVLDATTEQQTTELNIVLCMALCYLGEHKAFVAPEWVWRIDPFSLDNRRQDFGSVAETDDPVAISETDLVDIERWSMLVDDTDSRGIRLAMSRLYTAAKKPDTQDALVDVIIALRNIFAASEDIIPIKKALSHILERETDVTLIDRLAEDWQALLTGEFDASPELISEKVYECVQLCLTCLHYFYLHAPSLISRSDRLAQLCQRQE